MLQKNPEGSQTTLESWDGENLIGDVIKEDVIWSCTTCGHCIANCPLLIEHVDNIIDMRRYLVQLASRFPKELTQCFKGFENLSNPWGMASNIRGDWFKDLGVQTPEEKPPGLGLDGTLLEQIESAGAECQRKGGMAQHGGHHMKKNPEALSPLRAAYVLEVLNFLGSFVLLFSLLFVQTIHLP